MLRIILGWILLLATMVRPLTGEYEEARNSSVEENRTVEESGVVEESPSVEEAWSAESPIEEVLFSVGEAASAEINEECIVYREGELVEYLPLP